MGKPSTAKAMLKPILIEGSQGGLALGQTVLMLSYMLMRYFCCAGTCTTYRQTLISCNATWEHHMFFRPSISASSCVQSCQDL